MYLKNLFLVLIFFFTYSFLIAQEKSLTLKELCKESSDIVIGTPIAINSYDEGKGVYSLIDISIEKKIKGNLDNLSIVRIPMFGGTINGITTYAVGFPLFSLKVKSLFFLKEDHNTPEKPMGPQRIFLITGLSQGKMDIFEKDGKKILKRHYPETSLKLEENGRSISFTGDNPTTIEEMTLYITNYLNN